MVSENLLLAQMFVSVNGGGVLLCGGKVGIVSLVWWRWSRQ
jgi:hypothetical protein